MGHRVISTRNNVTIGLASAPGSAPAEWRLSDTVALQGTVMGGAGYASVSTINGVEKAFRTHFPQVRWSFFEPDDRD